MSWFDRYSPFLLAAVVSLLNAGKPVVVDDTAYLLFARHLAVHPLDPYGFDLFWYDRPEPAMGVLLPPVLPYWLAAGVALFGERLVLLKLWVFPFAWVLCVSVRSLFRRFAPGSSGVGTAVFVLSPAVLPLFNFMLDVPALALGTAAVAVFAAGCDRERLSLAAAAGVLVGLAMQTKYSMLVTPAVLGWYALTRPVRGRRVASAAVAVLVAAAVFAGWEWFLHQQYGESHFLLHLRGQSAGKPLTDRLDEKLRLVGPLLAHVGVAAAGVSFWASRAAGFARAVQWTTLALVAVATTAMGATAAADPYAEWPAIGFPVLGVANGVTLGLAAWQAGRVAEPRRLRELAFLAGWVVIEAFAGLALTPFAAARRVMGVTLAGGVLAGFAVSRLGSPRWTAGVAVGVGLAVATLDLWDAYPEKAVAERAAAVAGPSAGGTVWFNGHWGFQYYCERLGMRPVVPGQSRLQAGDRLVVPLPPPGLDDGDFFRPHHGWAVVRVDPTRTELLAVVGWEDGLPLSTLPSLYGGGTPMRGQAGPRVLAAVYRVLDDWVP
jgi:hypothetical protein